MSTINAAQFLSNRETRATDVSPESRVMSVLAGRRMIPLTDVADLSGLTKDQALALIETLRRQGKAVVLERRDGQRGKYLSSP